MNAVVNILRGTSVCAGLLGAAFLMGCSGGDTPGASMMMTTPTTTPTTPAPSTGGGSAAGKTTFTTKVYPLLSSECGACHSGGGSGPTYMGKDPDSSYTTIITKSTIFTTSSPTTSALITKGKHEGPALSSGGVSAVTEWLTQESTAAPPPSTGTGGTGSTGGTGGVTFNAVMQEFINCMQQNDWEQKMSTFPFNQTLGGGSCAGCHEFGNGGTFLNADKDITFNNIKTVPYVYRLATVVYDGDQIKQIAPSDRLVTKGFSTTNCFDPMNIICHFPYNLPLDQSDNLHDFQNRTLSRIQGLKCVGF